MSFGLCTDARWRLHRPPGAHPEHPDRLAAIERALDGAGLIARAVACAPRPATLPELRSVHDAAYVEAIERQLGAGGSGWLDPDTYYSEGTLEAARLASGAAVDLTARVLDGELDSAAAFVRPPGHHATRDRAMGFCIYNHVAVAAQAARARGAKVAIFDWDVHHGNGTEEIFFEDPDVLYVSTHEWPQYPGTGRAEDRGRGRGEGFNVNVPLPSGTGPEAYLAAFRERVLPPLERFRPDLLLISAGFDAHRDDPLGGLLLLDETYATLTRALGQVQPRRVVLLEGGYHLDALARSARRVVETLLDP
jgi:acetoin utilization deacetylase AcuC-like enzyme